LAQDDQVGTNKQESFRQHWVRARQSLAAPNLFLDGFRVAPSSIFNDYALGLCEG
jgi:hypothetical protein